MWVGRFATELRRQCNEPAARPWHYGRGIYLRRCRSHCDTGPDRHRNRNGDGDADACGGSDADADADGVSVINGNADIDADRHTATYVNADGQPDADAERNPNDTSMLSVRASAV